MNEFIPPMEQQSALSAKKSHFGKFNFNLESHVESHFLPPPEKISVFGFKNGSG